MERRDRRDAYPSFFDWRMKSSTTLPVPAGACRKGARKQGPRSFIIRAMRHVSEICIAVFCLLWLEGCTPRVITQIRVERDTTYITNHTRDSVYFRDSVYLKEYVKGDTVRITEYRERWRERIKEVHDTTVKYQLLRDSVTVEVPVRVEKKLSPVKKFKIWAFFPLIILALVGWRKEIMKLVSRIV